MIPQSFIQDLLNRVDIVDVVEHYVPLRRAGTNYKACCPFHTEKTPSFTVSQSKQFYHCFGCGAHGSAVGFLMEYKGLRYVEAIEELAALVGMTVPREASREPAAPHGEALNVLAALDQATRFYRDQLKKSDRAIAYLKGRGLTGTIAARFGIGYAPAGWQGLAECFPDYQSKVLEQAGLVIRGEDGKRYDRFRDRVMFPIVNQKGQVVGFGGRVLGEGEPKYLNSPETPVFEKGRELYGLFQARRPIRDAGKVLVVEGYMDVVALAQHGIEYGVATLGTATTPAQVQKLLRQTDQVVFCFDGDEAGRRAAWRALENSLAQVSDGKEISFLFLPAGEDPDSLVRSAGAEGFARLLQDAVPLSVFLLRELVAPVDLKTDEGRTRLLHTARPLVTQIGAPMLGLMVRKRLAELAGITQPQLEELYDLRSVPESRSMERAVKLPAQVGPYHRLARAVLLKPGLAAEMDRTLFDGRNPQAAALIELLDFIESTSNLEVSRLIPLVHIHFRGHVLERVLELVLKEIPEWDENFDLDAEVYGSLDRLRRQREEIRMKELSNKGLEQLSPEERQELAVLSGSQPLTKNQPLNA